MFLSQETSALGEWGTGYTFGLGLSWDSVLRSPMHSTVPIFETHFLCVYLSSFECVFPLSKFNSFTMGGISESLWWNSCIFLVGHLGFQSCPNSLISNVCPVDSPVGININRMSCLMF